MSDSEDENSTLPPQSSEQITLYTGEQNLPMDLDFDFDTSWPLNQISFVSSPKSPFLLPSFDQPCSPLWAFSDVDNDKSIGNGSSTVAGGLRLSDSSLFRSLNAGNADVVSESPMENEDERKQPSAVLGPRTLELDGSRVIKERMTRALRYFIESTEQHVLAQVWAPVKTGGRYVLTTLGQPYVLGRHNYGLHQYRMASLMYMFSADGESDGDLGLPGRVFRQKLPEWTPNVQYYTNSEYPRRIHALNYNVRGSLGLPVFEPSGQSCIGVVELIMTSEKINYAPEVDKVCKALEVGYLFPYHAYTALDCVLLDNAHSL